MVDPEPGQSGGGGEGRHSGSKVIQQIRFGRFAASVQLPDSSWPIYPKEVHPEALSIQAEEPKRWAKSGA
jgi:hypothetical protein